MFRLNLGLAHSFVIFRELIFNMILLSLSCRKVYDDNAPFLIGDNNLCTSVRILCAPSDSLRVDSVPLIFALVLGFTPAGSRGQYAMTTLDHAWV